MHKLNLEIYKCRRGYGLHPEYAVRHPVLSLAPLMSCCEESGFYIDGCVPEQGFSLYQITLDSADEISQQFEDWSPLIGPFGFIRIATLSGLECCILDVVSGKVFYTALDEYEPALYRGHDVPYDREYVSNVMEEVAYARFDSLVKFFEAVPAGFDV